VDEMTPGQVFLQIITLSTIKIIPPMRHTHSFILKLLFIKMTSEARETSIKAMLFGMSGDIEQKSLLHSLSFQRVKPVQDRVQLPALVKTTIIV
jgi:hypothetical protein